MSPPTFSGFRVSADRRRGEIVLDRGDELNPLSTQTLLDLARAAAWFDTQKEIRVVVVSGEGRAFSAGADLRTFSADGFGDIPPEEAADAGRQMADALEAMTAVTIARIHGHCVGGGIVLAAACDLRVAAAGTRFAIPEVDLGIPLAWGGINRLVREIGPTRTKELVMTCRPFFADEALAIGFCNRVVPEQDLDSAVAELANLIEQKPVYAVSTTKRSVNEVTAEMFSMAGAAGDAGRLLTGLADPEGQASAQAYLRNRRKSD